MFSPLRKVVLPALASIALGTAPVAADAAWDCKFDRSIPAVLAIDTFEDDSKLVILLTPDEAGILIKDAGLALMPHGTYPVEVDLDGAGVFTGTGVALDPSTLAVPRLKEGFLRSVGASDEAVVSARGINYHISLSGARACLMDGIDRLSSR
jgi:hypothetical protein